MKTTIMHLMSLFLILAFSASCGKKEGGSSGSSSNNGTVSNPVNTTGTVAQQNLINWYNSTVEGAKPSLAVAPYREVFKVSRTISSNNGCSTQSLWIFGSINLCGSISGGSSSSPVSEGFVTLLPSGDKKSGNSNLASALAPLLAPGTNGLYLVNITQAVSQQSAGSVFTITYAATGNKKVIQIIDTGFNSRLNPVYSYDSVVTLKETSLHSISPNINI